MGNAASKHKHHKRSVGSRKVAPPPLPPRPEDNPYFDHTYIEHIKPEPVPFEHIHADIDSCISRLIKAGSSPHIGKEVCISQPEMIAICRYAYDLFLTQPVNMK